MRSKVLAMMLFGAISLSGFAEPGLKVMSYNIRQSKVKDGSNAWALRKEATPAMIYDTRPDIMGVQEAYLDQLQYIVAQCPAYQYVGGGRDDGKQEGEHTAIFYNSERFRVAESGMYWLSQTPDAPSLGWDAKYKRTATWAVLEDISNKDRILVVNTHVDSKPEACKQSFRMIQDWIKRKNAAKLPVLLMGDLNVDPEHETMVELSKKMQSARTAAAVADTLGSYTGYGKRKGNNRIIDYIYFTGFDKCYEFRVADRSYAGVPYISDHYPIYAVFDWKGPAAPALSELPFTNRGDAVPVIADMPDAPFTAVRQIADVPMRGTALYLNGKQLYYGGGNSICLFDISNPLAPQLLGSCTLPCQSRQIVAKDGIAYVSCRGAGLYVVDFRDPTKARILTRYDSVELATGVDIAGNVLFIGQRQYGVEFVDISDPANPRHICLQKTAESQSVCYSDGYLYSGEWAKGEISIIDARNMADIQLVRTVKLKGYGDGICVNGPYLYAATGHHLKDNTKPAEETKGKGHGLEIFDLSDPAKPAFVSRVAFDPFYTASNDFWSPRPTLNNAMVFVSDTFNGVYAVNTKNPEKPVIAGRVSFLTKAGERTPVSALAVGNGVVYAAAYNAGLCLITCPKARYAKEDKGKLPVNASFRDGYALAKDSHFSAWRPNARAQVRGVATDGRLIYAACSDDGLYVLQQRKDGALEPVRKALSGYAGDVKYRDGKLYVAEGEEGLAVYALSGEGVMRVIARYKDKTDLRLCLWVWAINDDYIVASGRYGGYVFLDARNLNNLVPVYTQRGVPGWDKYIPSEACPSGWIPYNYCKRSTIWINLTGKKPVAEVTDKEHRPLLTTGFSNYKAGNVITVIDNALCVLEPGKQYAAPVPGVKGDFEGMPYWDGVNRLSLTYRIGREIRLVDVTDDANPKLLFKESTKGNPETPCFYQGKLLVPCGYEGLLIQK